MSKLSHSHQPSMNRIERERLVKDGVLPTPSDEALENGEVCAICWKPTECNGYAGACEECGGDLVLDEEAFEEIVQGHGQFGVGA
jgi:hypothetical protein